MSITPAMLAQMRAEIAPVKTGAKPRPKTPERTLQEAVVRFLDACLPPLSIFWATPNGQRRTVWEQREFLALGGRAGIPDLLIASGGRVVGVELKSPTGRLSGEQRAVCARLKNAGIPVETCRSVEDVQAFLDRVGIPLRGRIAA
jgi:hypothetical protein